MDSNDFRWIQVDEQVTLALTVEAVRKAADAEPVAVMCGGETGVKAPGVRLHMGNKDWVETAPHLRGKSWWIEKYQNNIRNLQFWWRVHCQSRLF